MKSMIAAAFLGTAAMTIAAAEFGMDGSPKPPNKIKTQQAARSGTNASFGPLKQIDAGLLNIGYAETGPTSGRPVMLLHGWPYDIHSFVEVAPLLASAGDQVIVPYLRGYGTTRSLSSATPRNGQQSALAVDVIALMDPLKIEKAILGGFDWGGRNADIVAVLWPERCKALVSVSGYLIGSQQPASCLCRLRLSSNGSTNTTLLPNAAATVATRIAATLPSSSGSSHHRNGTSMTPPSIAARRPLTTPTTLSSSSTTIAGGSRWPKASPNMMTSKRSSPKALPSLCPLSRCTLEGDANGAPQSDARAYASKFAGKYEHRVVNGGVRHNLPQEAPGAFAKAVVDVDGECCLGRSVSFR